MSTPLSSVAIIGCGWLGKALATELTAMGHPLMVTSRSQVESLKSQGLDAIALDLSPDVQSPEFSRLAQADVAVILLPPRARSGDGALYPQKINALVTGLKQLGVYKVVFASSTSVYPSLNQDADESCELKPDMPSGKLLRLVEQELLQDSELNACVIRFAGLVGPAREPGQILAGKKAVKGPYSPVNLIHQQDAVGVLVKVLQCEPWGEIFNACAPIHPNKVDLYPAAARALGLEAPEFVDSPAPFKRIIADKIEKQLGYTYRLPDPRSF